MVSKCIFVADSVDVWQRSTQYWGVIILKLKINKSFIDIFWHTFVT